MRKYCFVFTLVLTQFSAVHLLAQEVLLPKNIQSPNASSLGQYGNFPISYFNGSADISIPLESFNIGDVPLNISLNYNTSGIRVDSHTGIVGQNWTLNAGGVITRSIRGWEDEKGNQVGGSGYLYYDNYFHSCQLINQYNLESREELIQLSLDRAFASFDPEPDIYTFSFMGHSGYFFLGNDGKWKVNSSSNLTVVFDYTDNTNYESNLFEFYPPGDITITPYKRDYVIKGFKLIDDKGTTYIFGYNKNAIEFSIPFFRQIQYAPGNYPYSDNWIANSWYITKVLDKFGNEVYSFNYSRGYYIAEFSRNESKRDVSSTYCSSSQSFSDNVTGSLISPVYLQSINNLGQTLASFDYNDVDNEITYDLQDMHTTYYDLVAIYNQSNGSAYLPFYYLQYDLPNVYPAPLSARQNNALLGLKWKKLDSLYFQFSNHALYVFNYNNNSNERLCLKSIDRHDGSWPYNPNHEKITHRFEYIDFSSLPGYLKKMVDHWGFYNGHVYSLSNLSSYYQERNSNPVYLQKGMLEYVYYPTGGFTKFEYENQTYSKIVSEVDNSCYNESGIAGGVRIKKIINNDGTNDTWKEFKYVTGYNLNHNASTSSGILNKKPKYLWDDWSVLVGDGWNAQAINNNNIYYSEDVFSVNSLVPLSNLSGPQIGYSEVAEVRPDNSYAIYRFTNYDQYPDEKAFNTIDATSSPYEPNSDLSFMRGLMKEVEIYNNENNPVKKTLYEYPLFDNSKQSHNISYCNTVNCMFGYDCPGNDHKYFRGNATRIYFFDYLTPKQTTYDYMEGNPIISEQSFDYQHYYLQGGISTLLRSKSMSTSEGHQIISRYTYPMDILYLNNCTNSFNNCNQVALANKNARDMGCYGNATCLEVSLALYIDDTIQCRNQFGTCSQYPTLTGNIGDAFILEKMIRGNNLDYCIEEQTIRKINNTEKYIGGRIVKYKLTPGDDKPVPDSIFEFETESPTTIVSQTHLNQASSLQFDNHYKVKTIYDKYTDYYHKPLQYHTSDGLYYSINWRDSHFYDYYPISITTNATNNDCDFTSFETGASGWNSYPSWHIEENRELAKTGEHLIQVNGSGPDKYFPIGNNADKHSGYTACVWVKGGEDAFIHIQVNDSWELSRRVHNPNTPAGSWNLIKVELPYSYYKDLIGPNLRIKVYCGSTGQAYFDDLRFYPMDAQMKSYSYKPFIGMTSESDINNKPITYEYDLFGRLVLVKDFLGDIMKKYDYHFKE